MSGTSRSRLLEPFKARAVSFGKFKLASGKENTCYINRSVLQAVAAVERAGGVVVAVSCIVDRLEGAREWLTPQYQYLPTFTIRDFGIEPSAPWRLQVGAHLIPVSRHRTGHRAP